MTIEHSDIGNGEIHTPFNWVVPDAVARQALTPPAGDVRKVLLQQDDESEWLLISTGPAVWRRRNGTEAFEQATPLATWTVPHNLNRYPSVTVTDHLGSVLLADVQYVDANTVQINHSVPMIGKAYCN